MSVRVCIYMLCIYEGVSNAGVILLGVGSVWQGKNLLVEEKRSSLLMEFVGEKEMRDLVVCWGDES